MPRGTVTSIRCTSNRSYVFYLLCRGLLPGQQPSSIVFNPQAYRLPDTLRAAVTRCVSRVIHRFFQHAISFSFFIYFRLIFPPAHKDWLTARQVRRVYFVLYSPKIISNRVHRDCNYFFFLFYRYIKMYIRSYKIFLLLDV